jgi:hypothetical protein
MDLSNGADVSVLLKDEIGGGKKPFTGGKDQCQ